MVAIVKQSACRLLLPDDPDREMVTGNVGPCTVVAATDGNGTAFLCHFDTPSSVDALSAIADVLKDKEVNMSQLQMYLSSNGCGWIWPWTRVKRRIYKQLELNGFPKPAMEKFSANPCARLKVRVYANSGAISPSRDPDRCKGEGTEYDPDRRVCIVCWLWRIPLIWLGLYSR